MIIEPVAVFRSPLKEKFGIPRQSGLAPSLRGYVEFLPPFSAEEALRGLEGFERLWLIWGFNLNKDVHAGLTVRPPRLGGNRRLGVWASRSPYRPNPLGLSCVKIESIPGPGRIEVSGADLADGTPIFDVEYRRPVCKVGAAYFYPAGTGNRFYLYAGKPERIRPVRRTARPHAETAVASKPRRTYGEPCMDILVKIETPYQPEPFKAFQTAQCLFRGKWRKELHIPPERGCQTRLSGDTELLLERRTENGNRLDNHFRNDMLPAALPRGLDERVSLTRPALRLH